MKSNIKAAAITFGALWATLIFWATLMAMFGSGPTAFRFFDHFYFGLLSPSFGGLILGTLFGFMDGLICGALLALLYNALIPESQKNAV